ncbi:MAG: ABC transporter permease subunit [Acidimicrobiales bacterium]
MAIVTGSQTLITGAVTGLTYAVLGAGLVLVYRATKVINFAHGQIGAFGAAVLAKLVLDEHWNFFVALPAVLAIGALIGAAVELGVVRRLFNAPRLLLFVATLGVSQVMLVAQYLLPKIHKQHGTTLYPSPLHWSWKVGGVRLSSPDLMVLFIVPTVIAALALFLDRTWYGLAIRAAAENPDKAELAAISTRRVSTLVWVLAGVLATLTAVLLNPVRGDVVGLPSAALGPGLLLPALAAGLVGGLRSLPRTLAGGVVIGVVEAVLVVNFPRSPGVVDFALFVLILLLALAYGRDLDDRTAATWSLSANVRPVPPRVRQVWWVANLTRLTVGAGLAAAVALPAVITTSSRNFLFSDVAIVALVGLSLTVLTGWAGQLSFGQFAFTGLGAVTATALVARGYSFPVAVAFATVAGTVAAVIVGIPALRVRGSFVAVTTLAFAIASQSWLLRLHVFSNGTATYNLPRTTVWGVDLHSQRTYYFICLAVLVAAAAAIARLRRTGIGRSMVAVRDNEPAAASFGMSPALAKLSALAFAGGLAALAGALLAGLQVFFSLDNANGISPFGPEQSLQIVAMAVIGGLGSVGGTLLGALYVVGLPALFNHNPMVGFATSGVGLLALLLYLPGGLAGVAYRVRDAIVARAERLLPPLVPSRSGVAELPAFPTATRPILPGGAALEVVDVTVRFGGITALDAVTITVATGEIVGLIGSNGAGKSTLMNVVSGFQPSAVGSVGVWGDDVTDVPAYRRARMGIGRVFQDARLFGGLTVRETAELALETRERSEFVPSLLGYPPARRLERRQATDAAAYVDFLGLGRYADTFLSDLSTGTRRIVELCCLLARGSRLLLLDEPTAGVAQRETEAFAPLIQRVRAELDATVVVIEHDMPLVMSISDRLYCMAAGRVIAEGTPAAVRADPQVIAAYLGTDDRAIARSGAAVAGNGRPGGRRRVGRVAERRR